LTTLCSRTCKRSAPLYMSSPGVGRLLYTLSKHCMPALMPHRDPHCSSLQGWWPGTFSSLEVPSPSTPAGTCQVPHLHKGYSHEGNSYAIYCQQSWGNTACWTPCAITYSNEWCLTNLGPNQLCSHPQPSHLSSAHSHPASIRYGGGPPVGSRPLDHPPDVTASCHPGLYVCDPPRQACSRQ
jgi:hypothetical protein